MSYCRHTRHNSAHSKAPYAARFKRLSSYGRTLDYYRIMFNEGPYALRRESCIRTEVELVDQINYAYRLFDDPLPMKQLLNAFKLEAGYGVPDGSYELGPFIRHLEMCRADRFAGFLRKSRSKEYRQAISNSAVGLGHGVTGTLTNVIGSILRTRRLPSSNIVTVSPNYCIAEDVARFYGLHARILQCTSEQRFLPDITALKALCDDGTAAICLTIPANPSHDAWTIRDAGQVEELIGWCQEREVFFVLDTIFQDQSHCDELIVEPFVLAGSDYCIVKVFGPSKDRPFACGNRVGYYIGDRRIAEAAYQLSHITLNSPNAYSKMWFAFELLFRATLIQKRELTSDDCEIFCDSFLFGEHFRHVRSIDIWNIISDMELFERYRHVVDETRDKVRSTMVVVNECVRKYPCFVTRRLPNFGNSLFVKVAPQFYTGTDHDFFWQVLTKTNVGILVGNAFGFPFPSKEIWFRVACVAEEANTLVERVERIAKFLGCPKG